MAAVRGSAGALHGGRGRQAAAAAAGGVAYLIGADDDATEAEHGQLDAQVAEGLLRDRHDDAALSESGGTRSLHEVYELYINANAILGIRIGDNFTFFSHLHRFAQPAGQKMLARRLPLVASRQGAGSRAGLHSAAAAWARKAQGGGGARLRADWQTVAPSSGFIVFI